MMDIVAVTIGDMENPKLVCWTHMEGLPTVVAERIVLGRFSSDDLEPGEVCQAALCGKVLGPSLD
jgi:hypothetical protein